MVDSSETTDAETTDADQANPAGGVAPATPPVFSLRVRWGVVVAALIAAACLPTWLSLAARAHWLLDLATCFVWWYAATLPLLLAVALGMGRGRLALLVLASLAINLVWLLPYVPGVTAHASAPREETLRVMSLNVLTSNDAFDDVLRLVEREEPDVLVLLEVDQRWAAAMTPLADRYPHHKVRTRQDNFGVALFSRLPTKNTAARELTANGTPTVIAQLDWQGEPLTIVGAHPLPPMSPTGAATRNADLAALVRFSAEQPGDVVLMGDLNITPFSPHFGDLLNAGGLRDSAADRGLYATWGTSRLGLVIPIDHVLHTPGLRVANRLVGPHVGSDHRPVIVDFFRPNPTDR